MYYCLLNRSTPVECLHTILLGPVKYLFGDLMEHITPNQKKEVAARIQSFPKSGFKTHLSSSIVNNHKSGLGRDFKLLAQMALFVVWDYLRDGEHAIWLSLCKVRQLINVCIIKKWVKC